MIYRLFIFILFLLNSSCGDIRIGKPDMFWLFWFIPVLILFYIYSFKRKKILLNRFASKDIIERISAGVYPKRQYLKATLIILAFLFCFLALTEIKWGFTWKELNRRGVDIVLALDVSDSMLVEDADTVGKLTRLERAKREIIDLLRMMNGDRIALVAFAGTAFLECPLTLDYGAAELFLQAIDTSIIPIKGTSIDEAIRVSIDAFDSGKGESQAIILITDGEDHSGRVLKMAEVAKKEGIRIFTIGIGTQEGSPIPLPNGGFRRDRQNEHIFHLLLMQLFVMLFHLVLKE